jgi:DNA replication licensing factor MCM6
MINEYKKLRQRENSNKSAWRITVRQLESMIRLSEALARMHLLEEVKAEHVEEAFKLLSKSIIRVEQPDIQFDDNCLDSALNPNNIESITAVETNQEEQQNNQTSIDGNAKQSTKLSYDEYKRISNMLVYFIRRKEEEIDTESNLTFQNF